MDKKICTKCGKEKTVDNFSKQKQRKDGRHSHCRECVRAWQHQPEVWAKIKEYRRRYDCLRYYKITWEERKEILQKQEGKCAICKDDLSEEHVDHDHKTNKIRGILCRKCNVLIGMAKEDVEILKSAAIYLQFFAS